MNRGDELVVHLDSLASEGKTVARTDGIVVFVQGGAPGDDARVRIRRTRKAFLEAELVEVVHPSALRMKPRCRYFGVCGGCTLQHIRYHAQLDFKRQHVVDVLERIGGFSGHTVNETLGVDDPYFYRNKMEFSFGTKWLERGELDTVAREGRPTAGSRFALGLHIPQRFDRVLDLEECWLQSENSVKIVNAVREFCLKRSLSVYSTATHTGYLRNLVIRESAHTGEVMVNLVTREDRPDIMQMLCDRLLSLFPGITTITNNITERKSQVAVGDREIVYHGDGYITEKLGSRTYRISANSFFQTNTRQAERLYETVRTMAELKPGDVVFDLYSGTGTIALSIAGDVREVVGIESVESAIADAQNNALTNNVRNCTFVLGDLKEKLTRDAAWLDHRALPDVIILDPPRAGMHEKAARQLLRLNPRRMVYISCNPATQARDLKILCGEGTYRIDQIQPIDMFPHTFHVENVVSIGRSPL
jgi:23S rRNA (uracil1939-C5)-methyltransferase